MSEPFSTTEPTETTERGALIRILGKEVWMRISITENFLIKRAESICYILEKLKKINSLT
jgi:hypothetical protein